MLLNCWKPLAKPSLKNRFTSADWVSRTLVIWNTAEVSLSTDLVCCTIPSMTRLMLDASPVEKPVPVRVIISEFDAASKEGIKVETEATGAT